MQTKLYSFNEYRKCAGYIRAIQREVEEIQVHQVGKSLAEDQYNTAREQMKLNKHKAY